MIFGAGGGFRRGIGVPRGPCEIGDKGPPGKVSAADLSFAIGGTSANSNMVQTRDSSFADADTETLRQKLNKLIAALRR